MKTPRLSTLLLLATVAFVSIPLLAAVDGTMSGLVRDTSGGLLPGVTVTVRAPVLQGARTAVTRADGTWRLLALPPGSGYEAAFALPGFREARVADLSVRLGLDTQVNPVLELTAVAAAAAVTESAPLVDTTQTNTSQTLNAEHLRTFALGSRTRSYQNVISQVAGVSGYTGAEGLQFNAVSGGWLNENVYLVDGVPSNDPVDHYWGVNLGYESIQEISVQTSSFLPEYGRATGGVVSVVTRSGGNELHGAADVRSTSSELSGTGEYFDPEATPYRSTPWTLGLGGPFVKDALWFYGNVQRVDDVTTPSTTDPVVLAQVPVPADRRADGWTGGGKVSFTASERFNGFASYSGGKTPVENTYGSANVSPEAVFRAVNETGVLSLKLNGVLSDRLFGELQVGRLDSFYEYGPTDVDLDVSAWINRTGRSVRYDNATSLLRTDRTRTLLGLSASYFLPDLAGNHELKAGGEAGRTGNTETEWRTGQPTDPSFCTPEPGKRGAPDGSSCGAYFQFNGFDASGQRVPFRQLLAERVPEFTQEGEGYGVYLQDQWRPVGRLTVNLGLRWDRNEYFNNEGLSVTRLDELQPRVSVAYDLTGDGRTAARASWGRFSLEVPLSLISMANTGRTPQYFSAYAWSAAAKKWSLIPGSEIGGMAQGILDTPPVDGKLDAMYEDQVSVAVEREVAHDLSVTASYLDKRSRSLIDDTCNDYEECGFWWLTNWPGRSLGLENPMKRSYRAWIVEAAWRVPGGRGLATASYVYSKTKGSVEMTEDYGKSGDFDMYPWNFTNRYGYLSTDLRHQVKVFGSYRIPRVETTVAVGWTWRSGAPWTPWDYDPDGIYAVFVEPRGSRRTADLHNVDLQLEQRFVLDRVTKGLSLSLFASVFNLLDDETPMGATTWVQSPVFGQPTSYARPRSFELGARIEF